MTDFADYVEAFQREVAIPGTFAAAYPSTTDDDITASLMDAFAQAQLDGFFPTSLLDPFGGTVAPDLSTAGGALVVVYAGMRFIRAELRGMTNNRYKAGPVEYEVNHPATILTQLLKDLAAQRDKLLEAARIGKSLDFVLDGYWGRAWQPSVVGYAAQQSLSWLPYEIPAFATMVRM